MNMTLWQKRKRMQAELKRLKLERDWKRRIGDLEDWENAWYWAKIRDLEAKLKVGQE